MNVHRSVHALAAALAYAPRPPAQASPPSPSARGAISRAGAAAPVFARSPRRRARGFMGALAVFTLSVGLPAALATDLAAGASGGEQQRVAALSPPAECGCRS